MALSVLITFLLICLASEVAPSSSPPSSSLSRCPFALHANGTFTINKTDELKRRDVTPEQFDEHLAALVWCLPKTYNMEKPPFVVLADTQRLNLAFRFDIREISEIDDRKQYLSVPMYFSVAWLESRLWINETATAWDETVTGPQNEVTEDVHVMEEIWIPDLEIYGLEDFGSKKVLKEMSGLRIKKNKTLEYNARVTITVSCRMEFDNYPFDTHNCFFQVGSYYYFKDIVTCSSTFEDPTKIESENRQRNLQYDVSFHDLEDGKRTVQLTSGTYAACGFRVHLERKRHQLIFQIYLPCILFVVVSWISFLIRPSVVPGRMALLVTLFLVLVNVFNNVRSMAPSTSSNQLNAIDMYLVVCIFMVFFALLEYGIVLLSINVHETRNIRDRKRLLKSMLRKDGSSETEGDSDHHASGNGHAIFKEKDIRAVVSEINEIMAQRSPVRTVLSGDNLGYKLGKYSLRKVDMVALVVLPTIFFVFNVIYWAHFSIMLQYKAMELD